uniref:Transposase n=1 Tax=Ditylenchus dipsaci TaxID=166011 RepID=A0A915CS52_9BILA
MNPIAFTSPRVHLSIANLLVKAIVQCNFQANQAYHCHFLVVKIAPSLSPPAPVSSNFDAKKRGYSNRRLAVLFKLHSTVNRIVNRFEEEEVSPSRQRSGRPRKTSARDDSRLVKIVKDDPRKTATDVRIYANNNLSLGIATRTARRILDVVRPRLGRMLWSDESKCNLLSSDGIRYARRPPCQRNNPKYQVPTVKHSGGSIMVWGSISRDEMSPLHRIEEFMEGCKLQEDPGGANDARCPHPPKDWIFQHDNDPKHASKLVKKFLRTTMWVLKWPTQSLDLNPIEHLWKNWIVEFGTAHTRKL